MRVWIDDTDVAVKSAVIEFTRPVGADRGMNLFLVQRERAFSAKATSLPQPNPPSIPERICAYDWVCWEALAVAECESTFNPNAYNPSGASGVFQLMMPLHAWRLEGESPFNADANIKAAYGLYIEQGWWPWKQCWS